ncbi:MAG: MotA/TolQ/ExbB proton channel family protein [Verrucomicrobiae bacterium]|nr:MotA/TolQ/ExbB proton channel family protein [Verrucomicrobiae bacterium]
MNAVLATGLLYAIQQSDLQGQVIVAILCVGSALTWSVMLTKCQQLRRVRKSREEFLAHFRRHRDPLHLFINNFEMPNCPFYNIYRAGAEELSAQLGDAPAHRKSNLSYARSTQSGTALLTMEPEVTVSDRGVVSIATLRNALGRAIDAEIIKLESHLPILSTAVQGGPFLGLLGSAWGVMSVFAAMGQQGTVRLGAVAPGISAALAATVVGLLVAIPSLFAYNWLAARVRHQTMEMEDFADEFIAAVEHQYPTN